MTKTTFYLALALSLVIVPVAAPAAAAMVAPEPGATYDVRCSPTEYECHVAYDAWLGGGPSS